MIRTLTLENYRGFRRFELHELGRVNLLVGTNNSGKTSILEAVECLAGNGDAVPILHALRRRGEEFDDRTPSGSGRFLDIRHLFFGRQIEVGHSFRVSALAAEGPSSVDGRIARRATTAEHASSESQPDSLTATPDALEFRLRWSGHNASVVKLRLGLLGGVRRPSLLGLPKYNRPARPNIRLVTAASLPPEVIVELFEGIVLTAEEDLVIQTLNVIEPSIERIATGRSQRVGITPKGGLVLRCRGDSDRIPIGSMGDGIWRLLGLALSLVHCKEGILLVDEIDTGLHYSVMEKMWKLVTETARRLNIQVFATTHSRDCYESLAAVCREGVTEGSEVTIQRIEPAKARSVAYSEAEIIAAARWATEVR